ncbi:MAG TPA: diacylglycerol kinase family protein [Ktedonobacteraceae bacterium]
MVATTPHHTLHRLNRLITTFLAQMRLLPVPVEDSSSVSMKQSGIHDQSNASTDSTLTQVAPEPTIEQTPLTDQTLEPALYPTLIERDDDLTKNTTVHKQELQGQLLDKSTVKYSTGSPLRCKKAYLIINPRAGHNFTRIAEVLAILSAAGWKTDIAVKHYVGHAIELATRAAKQDYDLVIAYGGDGTINHVVNGVMAAKGKGRRKAIGVIPGGTANQWASETSVPVDPVKATLALIESNIHTVDVGRLQVQEILFPNQTQENQQRQQNGQKVQKSKTKQPSSRENYFLLTAGLGIDASVINLTSKALKQRVGPLAFDIAVAKSLPEQHSFPIEVTIVEDGQDQPIVWSGEAYQVILGNTRRYANAVELTPDVYLDDGKLELCVITAGNIITTLQQITSLLFRHKTDTITAKHFLATRFLITAPASVHLHLDGSAIELEDYVSKSERKGLRDAQDKEHVMVTYRFDAVPHALRAMIPRNYDNTLFGHASQPEVSSIQDRQRANKDNTEQQLTMQSESYDILNMLQEQGYKVKVNGVAQVPSKKQTTIMAGNTVKQRTGETRPVAVRIDEVTIVLSHNGEHAPLAQIQMLPDGAVIIAHGKKSKRGVIKAKHVVLPDS